MHTQTEKIINLIATGHLESAIKETLNLTKQQGSNNHFKSAVLLACRYNILWREVLDGTTSTEEKEKAINKIASSAYDLLRKIADTS